MDKLANLVPFTTDTAAFYGRLGGIASGRARRAKREEGVKKSTHHKTQLFTFHGLNRDCTYRQWRWCLAMMGEAWGCATRAAIIAGYSVKSARQIGYRLKNTPNVVRVWRTMVARLSEGKSII